MKSPNQIGFISTKIKQLQSAVLHTHPNDVLNLPDITVHAIDVDEGGCVWFTVLKLAEKNKLISKPFYVSLNFFKKEFPFFLNISGVATLITNKAAMDQVPGFIRNNVTGDRLLVCVKIMNAEYFEHERAEEHNWFQKCKTRLAAIFVDEDYPLVIINDPAIIVA
ncbi:MAG: hypothetical protein ABIN67_17490 [Ferruginibacter sp.]